MEAMAEFEETLDKDILMLGHIKPKLYYDSYSDNAISANMRES